MKRRGFLFVEQPSTAGIAVEADDALLRVICTNPNQVLSSLIPRSKQQYHYEGSDL